MSVSYGVGASRDLRRMPVRLWGAAARVLDFVVVTVVLVLFAPLMILIAVVIFVEDGRPIFFSQTRLGRGGRHFRMHKFRKFHECGRSTGHALTMEDDPRLTRVGGFLARTKLDELPQLWNILKGDMSLVGPRPESLDFADCFDEHCGAVLDHKPGIFGPSQVLFRNEAFFYRGRPDPEQFYRDVLFPLKAHIDLAYLAHRTLFHDIVWVVRGALAVLGCSSALREAAFLVEEAEERSRKDRRADGGLPAQTGLLARVARRGMVEIVREDGNEIAAGGLLPALASGRRYAADQAHASKGGEIP